MRNNRRAGTARKSAGYTTPGHMTAAATHGREKMLHRGGLRGSRSNKIAHFRIILSTSSAFLRELRGKILHTTVVESR
jgi:hypothetical protein